MLTLGLILIVLFFIVVTITNIFKVKPVDVISGITILIVLSLIAFGIFVSTQI